MSLVLLLEMFIMLNNLRYCAVVVPFECYVADEFGQTAAGKRI